jgi:RNA polymerase sigma-70 factor (ECF subfamily)
MQEISIALWRQRERMWSIPDGMQRTAWIWKVAHNAAIDTVRKAPAHQQLEDHHVADMQQEDRTLVEQLYEQIDKLEEMDRTLVRLQLEGYSYEEIATKTGLTVKNVSVKLVRIKDKLRKQFLD